MLFLSEKYRKTEASLIHSLGQRIITPYYFRIVSFSPHNNISKICGIVRQRSSSLRWLLGSASDARPTGSSSSISSFTGSGVFSPELAPLVTTTKSEKGCCEYTADRSSKEPASTPPAPARQLAASCSSKHYTTVTCTIVRWARTSPQTPSQLYPKQHMWRRVRPVTSMYSMALRPRLPVAMLVRVVVACSMFCPVLRLIFKPVIRHKVSSVMAGFRASCCA